VGRVRRLAFPGPWNSIRQGVAWWRGEHEFYGVIDVGDYLSLIALDTEMETVESQNEWLQGVLADRRGVTHVIPYYHRADRDRRRRLGQYVLQRKPAW